MINVTKTFLPSFDEYTTLLKKVWDSAWLTNNGALVQELEKKLKAYLDAPHLFFCSNGTVSLQLAIKALGLKKEIITTPFSYVATTASILWENCKPVFVDINPVDFNIDVEKIENAITPDTEAILAVHVYGNPCDVIKIEAIAKKHNLKVIYDGAHAFGVTYNNRQLLQYGDISTCSFHATKLFHTVEGGAVICNDNELANKIMLYRQFGHVYDDYQSIGINGKNSELHAAMGICVFNQLEQIIEDRKKSSQLYDSLLSAQIQKPKALPGTIYNYAYYPVILPSEDCLLQVCEALKKQQVFPRRYFYPSLNKLSYLTEAFDCIVSEDISKRVLSLPLYVGLEEGEITQIASIINLNLF
jgi:dTDP-4-amino-4,6-dideoxygalactose transaminase